MRQSQKAWVWRSIPSLPTGSWVEASAVAKESKDEMESQVLKGRSRKLLPRT